MSQNIEDQSIENFEDIDESKSTLIKILLIMILFSPLFSSAIIYLLFAGISNVLYYVLLLTVIVYLSYYSISHYRRTLEQRNTISM